jgi:tRNA dimethylallyltransferase
MLGLRLSRQHLYQRIDQRVEAMIAAGLEEEVRRLVREGYGFDLPAMSGVGYGQFAPYLADEANSDERVTLDLVIREIKRATRRFVRHQSNWFRRGDARIHWLDAGKDPYDAALQRVRHFLASSTPASPVAE